MRIIVAVDKFWGIGKNNDLLFWLKEDMKHFRETTSGKVVVMGRKTLQSLPGSKPLSNRINIVISSQGQGGEGYKAVSNLKELFEEIRQYATEEVYVIGGASVYKTLLPYCTEALITKVDADGAAEAYFEDLDKKDEWILAQESEIIEDNGYKIRFCTYKNTRTQQYK